MMIIAYAKNTEPQLLNTYPQCSLPKSHNAYSIHRWGWGYNSSSTNRYIIMCMKNVMYKILVGCYIVAALVLVTACNDGLDIQQAYPFTVETLPVPKKLKVGETAEIRCQLVRSGYYQPTTYQIRYFQPDGKGKLEMDDGTVFLPNDLYPLEKETFRLYYTSASTDQQTIDIYIIDSFGQMQQVSFSFNNDSNEEK